MQEIKFRAYNKVAKKFTYFGNKEASIEFTDENRIGMFLEAVDNVYLSPYEEPQMYSGLKDKNDKEIYEGDISDCSYINLMTQKRIKRYFKVVYENGVFAVKLIGHTPYGDTWLYFENLKGEVIGNIYENPELLKENWYEKTNMPIRSS